MGSVPLTLKQRKRIASQVSWYIDVILTLLLPCPYTDCSSGPHCSTYCDNLYIFISEKIWIVWFLFWPAFITAHAYPVPLGGTLTHETAAALLGAWRWAGLGFPVRMKCLWVSLSFYSCQHQDAVSYLPASQNLINVNWAPTGCQVLWQAQRQGLIYSTVWALQELGVWWQGGRGHNS